MKILFAARLTDFKDPLTFIKTSTLMQKHQFIVAGSGKLMTKCREEAGSNVKFLGWVTQTEVNQLMDECQIFCQLSPFENIWSSSLVGAMKHKMAIICTDVGYTRLYLQNMFNVLLIPSRNPKQLMLAIRKLVKDERLRFYLGENASLYVKERMCCGNILKSIELLVHSIVRKESVIK